MELNTFIKLLKKKWGTIVTLTFVTIILTIAISLMFPLKYESKSSLLVIQNTKGSDPYTVSKSNEYLGNLFAQVVYSSSFYNLVVSSNYNVDRKYFSGSYNEQIKKWQETIKTKTLNDTGIIEIYVYHPNPYQAKQISLAINDILINNNSEYQSNKSIRINVINEPLVSNYPTSPNIIQNAFIAFISGMLFSLFYIYLFPEKRYDLKLWTKNKNYVKIAKHKINSNYYHIQPAIEEINRINIDHKDNHNNIEINKEENYDNQEFRIQGDINNVFRNN